MRLEHYTQRFSCVITYCYKFKFKIQRFSFCTDSQPAHSSSETWIKTTAQIYKKTPSIKNSQDEICETQAGNKKHLKKKFAILFSYSGKNYFGLQRNRVVLTVEEELLAAMRKAEVISQENYENPYELYFQRASRTDKGVSALRQIVSLFLQTDVDSTTVRKINKYLPSQIQVMGIKRVTRQFDAKESCDSRLYSYMLPTFAFCPVDILCTEAYRLPRNGVDRINSILKEYEGRHNFHNFTNQRKYEEKSCFRHIFLCECGQPFIAGGLEFIIIRIKGQSFMLYQIRRMVGLAIAISRGLANMSTLIKSFNEEKIDIPMAPALGLMLEEIYYDRYNWKCGDGIFEPIAWEQFQDKLYSFREKYVRSDIVKTETKEKSMMKWLHECFHHTYDVRIMDEEKMHYITHLFKAASCLAKIQNEERHIKPT